jgi:hypothetical protein
MTPADAMVAARSAAHKGCVNISSVHSLHYLPQQALTWKLHAVTTFASQQLVSEVTLPPTVAGSGRGAKNGKGYLDGHTAAAVRAMHFSM